MSASSASAFQYSTGSRSRATRSPSGSSEGIDFDTSAHVRTVPVTTARRPAPSRVAARPPTAASTTPSPRNAAKAALLLNASQLRSGAIDHQAVEPVQATSSSIVATRAPPDRPSRGAATSPKATARSTAASSTTAEPPTGSTPSTPDPSPANAAPRSVPPTSTREDRRRHLRAPGRTAPAPHPWRARLPASALFPRFRRGVSDRPSNNSFTLHSRRPHQKPEDSSYFSGLRPRP